MLTSDIETLSVPFDTHTLIGDVTPPAAGCPLLMLHGGGSACRRRFWPLRRILADKGIRSCAFDFIGSGDSGGRIGDTSLHSRTRQAEAVITGSRMPAPISILGASMGAYTAVKLTTIFEVSNLILMVPAMYTQAVYRVRFSTGFSRLIRMPGSWIDSDAWDILDDFSGRLLVVAAADDGVIPSDVIDRIMGAATNARQAQLMTIADAPHQILSYLEGKGAAWIDPIAGKIQRLFAPAI